MNMMKSKEPSKSKKNNAKEKNEPSGTGRISAMKVQRRPAPTQQRQKSRHREWTGMDNKSTATGFVGVFKLGHRLPLYLSLAFISNCLKTLNAYVQNIFKLEVGVQI